jgi:hypothetical protein
VKAEAEPQSQKLTAVVQWAQVGEIPVRPVLGEGAGSSNHSATSRAWVLWARTLMSAKLCLISARMGCASTPWGPTGVFATEATNQTRPEQTVRILMNVQE